MAVAEACESSQALRSPPRASCDSAHACVLRAVFGVSSCATFSVISRLDRVAAAEARGSSQHRRSPSRARRDVVPGNAYWSPERISSYATFDRRLATWIRWRGWRSVDRSHSALMSITRADRVVVEAEEVCTRRDRRALLQAVPDKECAPALSAPDPPSSYRQRTQSLRRSVAQTASFRLFARFRRVSCAWEACVRRGVTPRCRAGGARWSGRGGTRGCRSGGR